MAKIDDLKAQAALIENETAIGGNTAKRVGGAIGTAAELIEENHNKIIDISEQKASKENVIDVAFEIGLSEGENVYTANAGIIYAENGVSKANSNYNGVLLRLAKNVRYSIVDSVTSIQKFNGFPKIGDKSVERAPYEFTQEIEGQYLLITLQLPSLSSVRISTSGYGIANDINGLKNDISNTLKTSDVTNNLDSSETLKPLSAAMGKKLNEEINGVQTVSTDPLQLLAGHYYNMHSVFSGGEQIYKREFADVYEPSYCVKVSVKLGEKMVFYTHNTNNTEAVGVYILTDNDGNIISAQQKTQKEVVLNIEQDGVLYVNFLNYDAALDYIKKYIPKGGYRDFVKDYVDNHPPKSKLYGKTIVCFGDSVTEFAGIDGYRYSDWIAKNTGANVINCGIGGTSFAQRTNPVATPTNSQEGYAGLDIISMVRAACGVMLDENTPFSTVVTNAAAYIKTIGGDNTDIVARLLAIEWEKVDAVTFFAGTNDWYNRVGSWGVSGSMDVNTTIGAINEIVRLMLSTYKHLKIYWFTPTVRWLNYEGGTGTDGDWSDVKIIGEGESARTLKEFSRDIENEVKLNHIPICDLYNTLGITKYNFSNYFTDGTHPRKGFDMLAERIASFIESNLSF